MECVWETYLRLFPMWMRQQLDKHADDLLEVRMRLNEQPEMIKLNRCVRLERRITDTDINFSVNVASKYSPWSVQTTTNGYITTPGGHRIGLCGSMIVDNGMIRGVGELTSLCIRVSRNIKGIANGVERYTGSVLIIGKPGSGKTTFLRDFIRQLSNLGNETIGVVDERQEIFPRENGRFCFSPGLRTDVISGCSKKQAVESMLRNMTPTVIAVDEITADTDCEAMMYAGWCGVRLIATAHAASRAELFQRPIYRSVIESKLFDDLIIIHPDKSWQTERIKL